MNQFASRQPMELRVPSRPVNRARDGDRGPALQHVVDFRTRNCFEVLNREPLEPAETEARV